MQSGPEETVPLGATGESPHIKVEPEELCPEEASKEGMQGWVPLSRGSQEKALFLPGAGRRGPREGVPREGNCG